MDLCISDCGIVVGLRLNGPVQRRQAPAAPLLFELDAGIVPRDIKPGNIEIMPKGPPVILDFGLARDEQSDLRTLTRSEKNRDRRYQTALARDICSSSPTTGRAAVSSSRPRRCTRSHQARRATVGRPRSERGAPGLLRVAAAAATLCGRRSLRTAIRRIPAAEWRGRHKRSYDGPGAATRLLAVAARSCRRAAKTRARRVLRTGRCGGKKEK